MVAISGDDMVVFTEKRNGSYRHGFLANVKVKEAPHLSSLIMLKRELLKSPDPDHLPMEGDLIAGRQFLVDRSVSVFSRRGGQGGHKKRAEDRQIVRVCKSAES